MMLISCPRSGSQCWIYFSLSPASASSIWGAAMGSRKSNSGVRRSLSEWMSTKNKIDREEVGMRSSKKQLKTGNNPEVTTPYGL
jgi:hypothetical protein